MRAEQNRQKKEEKPKKRRGAAASPFSNLTCGKLLNGKPCGARLVRMCYNNVVSGYKDDRCAEAEGLDPKAYKEHIITLIPCGDAPGMQRASTQKRRIHW